jgi:hypothetical protein
MGRPAIDVTDEHIRQIEKLAGYGMTEASIAWIIGMCPKTFYAKKQADERVGTALEKGKADAEDKIGEALYTKAINGDLGAIVWWEKTRANRYERSRQEITGKDGGPIQQEAVESPRQYIERELARLALRQESGSHPPKANGRPVRGT